jgi:hypothetical protein
LQSNTHNSLDILADKKIKPTYSPYRFFLSPPFLTIKITKMKNKRIKLIPNIFLTRILFFYDPACGGIGGVGVGVGFAGSSGIGSGGKGCGSGGKAGFSGGTGWGLGEFGGGIRTVTNVLEY